MRFRDTEKARLNLLVPGEINEALKVFAARVDRPMNEVVSAIFCKSLRLDPQLFGLENTLKSHKSKARAIASTST